MNAKRMSSMFVRLTALTMIASMAVNGFVPQRVNGSKDSLLLAVGDAGRAVLASLCGGIRDPLAEIAQMIVQDFVMGRAPSSEKKVSSSADEPPIPAAADVAFTNSLSMLPSPGDSASFTFRLPVPADSVALISVAHCRGSPPLSTLIDISRTIQITYVLLLFMTCRWASSTGVLRRIHMIVKNPVFNEYRVFLFINNQTLSCTFPRVHAQTRRVL